MSSTYCHFQKRLEVIEQINHKHTCNRKTWLQYLIKLCVEEVFYTSFKLTQIKHGLSSELVLTRGRRLYLDIEIKSTDTYCTAREEMCWWLINIYRTYTWLGGGHLFNIPYFIHRIRGRELRARSEMNAWAGGSLAHSCGGGGRTRAHLQGHASYIRLATAPRRQFRYRQTSPAPGPRHRRAECLNAS